MGRGGCGGVGMVGACGRQNTRVPGHLPLQLQLSPSLPTATHSPFSYASCPVANPQRYTPLLMQGYTHSFTCE